MKRIGKETFWVIAMCLKTCNFVGRKVCLHLGVGIRYTLNILIKNVVNIYTLIAIVRITYFWLRLNRKYFNVVILNSEYIRKERR